MSYTAEGYVRCNKNLQYLRSDCFLKPYNIKFDIEGSAFAISANSRVRDKMDLHLGVSQVKDEKIIAVQFLIGSLKIG